MARGKLPKWAIKKAGGINKKAWRLARAGRKGSKRASPKRRSNPRASPNRRKTMARKGFVTPHPSITGMAAGFSLLDDLNGGNGRGVLAELMEGNAGSALTTLSSNAQNLVKTDSGRKALVQAVGIAAVGAWARKALPATKIGGTKFYFRI